MNKIIRQILTALFIMCLWTFVTQINDILEYEKALILVEVTGAVNKPGIYKLPSGSRAVDAITVAGGATKDADLEKINLAQKLINRDCVDVPEL